MEIFTGDISTSKFPSLPVETSASTMFMHDGDILVCGGYNNEKNCLQLTRGTWQNHSTLNENRVGHSTVTTQTATFVFGGRYSESSYEYLPKGSSTWHMGKTNIPTCFLNGSAIAVKSDQEIWLIGGYRTETRILSFNVNDHTFQVLPSQLNVEREGHRCAFIPNSNKIMVCGDYKSANYTNATEIIDPEDGSVTMASGTNFKRRSHGIGIITINGEDRLVTFGGDHYMGNDLDSVELYNHQTERWETSDIKLKETKSNFGFLSLKLSDVISKL